MTTSPKPRVRKRAATPARPEPDAPAMAAEPVLTIAEVRGQADQLQAEKTEIERIRDQAKATAAECEMKLAAYDGALQVCVRFLDHLKAAGAS